MCPDIKLVLRNIYRPKRLKKHSKSLEKKKGRCIETFKERVFFQLLELTPNSKSMVRSCVRWKDDGEN
jgi:hypothetical protein